MGLMDRLGRVSKRANDVRALEMYFKTITAYSPAFTTFQGGLYEMDLTRAALHGFAKHCGKLKAKVAGAARPDLDRILTLAPNQYMDAFSFQYKLASIMKAENNAFIVPLFDGPTKVVGFWPVRPGATSIKVVDEVPYLKYETMYGPSSIEYRYVGHLRNHFYRDDFYGESNRPIDTTLRLIHAQNEGIIHSIKNGASLRFIARLAQLLNPKDLEAEREMFREGQLGTTNNGGALIVDNKYADVKQIDSQAYMISPRQAELIRQNVYLYFGTNEKIITSAANDDEWGSYYEGEIEPFAIQLSLVMTSMVYSLRQLGAGNEIVYESNRLQYSKNETKLNVVSQLFDRGMLTVNQGLEVFNMAPIGPDGDKRYIRKEYTDYARPVQDPPAADPPAPPEPQGQPSEDGEDDPPPADPPAGGKKA